MFIDFIVVGYIVASTQTVIFKKLDLDFYNMSMLRNTLDRLLNGLAVDADRIHTYYIMSYKSFETDAVV